MADNDRANDRTGDKTGDRTGDRIVELIRVPTRFEADALVAHLKSEDIPAYTAGSEIPGAYPGLQTEGAAVMVRERDVERARAVIE